MNTWFGPYILDIGCSDAVLDYLAPGITPRFLETDLNLLSSYKFP